MLFLAFMLLCMAINSHGSAADTKTAVAATTSTAAGATVAGTTSAAAKVSVNPNDVLHALLTAPTDHGPSGIAVAPTGPHVAKLVTVVTAATLSLNQSTEKLTGQVGDEAAKFLASLNTLVTKKDTQIQEILAKISELTENAKDLPKRIPSILSGREAAWHASCVGLAWGGTHMITQGRIREGGIALTVGMFGIAGSKVVLNNCTIL